MIVMSLSTLILIIILAMLTGMLGLSLLSGYIVR
jgi:hypothetical protein